VTAELWLLVIGELVIAMSHWVLRAFFFGGVLWRVSNFDFFRFAADETSMMPGFV